MIDPVMLWNTAFNTEIGSIERNTDTNPTDWRAGGRVSKEYPDRENKVWWDKNGPLMVTNFISWWQASAWQIWHTPTGVPGVEVDLGCSFGDVPVRGFADLIALDTTDSLAVIDLKTGASTPKSAMQLGIYASAMEILFGERPSKAYYYDARKAVMLPAEGLDRWTIPVLTELFGQFKRGLDAEIFLPNVGQGCSTCSVKKYCYAVGGEYSQIDPLTMIGVGE